MLPDLSYYKFLLTFIVEFLVVLAFMRKQPLKLAGFILLVNLFSWPIANLVYDFYNNLLIIEIFVFVIEGILLKYLLEVSYRKAFFMALVANLISFITGLLFFSY